MELTQIKAPRQSENNVLDTSHRPDMISDKRLAEIYQNCGIPPRICVISLSELETESRAANLWKNVTERAQTWKNGYSEKRGILFSGTQGAGKSTALFFSARAAVKSYLFANPPKDNKGFPIVPIFVKEFPEWLRFEFAPQNGSNHWNFELLDQITESRAIFFDDVTFDSSAEAFRPVREFLFLLVNRLSNMVKPPALYLSTNNNAKEWESLLGSQLVDRIAGKEHGLCELLKCDWESFR